MRSCGVPHISVSSGFLTCKTRILSGVFADTLFSIYIDLLIFYVAIFNYLPWKLENRQTQSVPSWNLESRETRKRHNKYLKVTGETPNLFEGYQGRLERERADKEQKRGLGESNILEMRDYIPYSRSWNNSNLTRTDCGNKERGKVCRELRRGKIMHLLIDLSTPCVSTARNDY